MTVTVLVIDALLIIGLPNGPTAHFKLSRLVLRKDIKVSLIVQALTVPSLPTRLVVESQSGLGHQVTFIRFLIEAYP